MSILLSPISVKGLTLKNRIVMPPMYQYSVAKKDGIATDWHFVHYLSRAIGGAGLIIVEATGVSPDGRITDNDLGLWDDAQMPALKRIVDGVHAYGAKIAIQLSHAGRKAQDAASPAIPSTKFSPIDSDPLPKPHELSVAEIHEIVAQFAAAVQRAVEIGFDAIEIHGAHGYLIHQFISLTINQRTDEYGQDCARFGVEVLRRVKPLLPESMPLLMRLSAIEYMDGGYELDHALSVAEKFVAAGVDGFHISSGGEAAPGIKKPGNYPGYQVPFAQAFKERFNLPTIAVGLLGDPLLAESVLANENADLVAVGRGMLKDAYWALHAEEVLTGEVKNPPEQYLRSHNRRFL